ncbi:MAG: HEAT repeat domain-containing protein [Pseudomonadota bacterium]
MGYASHIIYSDPQTRAQAIAYEENLSSLSLGEKLYQCQAQNEEADELSMSKMFLLFLCGEKEVSHEMMRIFPWKNKKSKSSFLIAQFQSEEQAVVFGAIDLIGVLQEPIAIPYLDAIFDIEKTDLCLKIVAVLEQINNPEGATIIIKALGASKKELVLLSIMTLSQWVDSVPWKTFKPLLDNEDKDIRSEAFSAITIRKSRHSAHQLLKSISHEQDAYVKHRMIQQISVIPSNALILPLLKATVHDEDQKTRLIASRTLDRLQGLINPKFLFRLRHASDIATMVEVLFRLGKFGSEIEAHKEYLRNTLKETDNPHIMQACLQALGFIAEHKDIDLLTEYLDKDPMAAYTAAMALTRIWRLDDKERVIEALHRNLTATQKQIILKYLIRRRGLGISPEDLLNVIKTLIKDEMNINVYYLAHSCLEYAPSVETIEFLVYSYDTTDNPYDREAIERALKRLALHHEDQFLTLIETCDEEHCCHLIRHLPSKMDLEFYRLLAESLIKKYKEEIPDERTQKLFKIVFDIFFTTPDALSVFLQVLPNAGWKRLFLKMLTAHHNRRMLEAAKEDLINLLKEGDEEIRALTIQLMRTVKHSWVLPHLISAAESDPSTDLRHMAQDATRAVVEEGML